MSVVVLSKTTCPKQEKDYQFHLHISLKHQMLTSKEYGKSSSQPTLRKNLQLK